MRRRAPDMNVAMKLKRRGWARRRPSLPRGEPVTLTLVASAARAPSRDSLSSATSLCTFKAAAVDPRIGTVCPATTHTDPPLNR